jgi:hypothetical protein
MMVVGVLKANLMRKGTCGLFVRDQGPPAFFKTRSFYILTLIPELDFVQFKLIAGIF